MARLSDEEFRAWYQRNNIDPRTQASIQRLPESEPERKVRSRASNVSGRYPSVKIGCSIQFESQHVELWCLYTWEAEAGATTVVLRPESGAVSTLSLEYFQRLVNEDVIKSAPLEAPSPLRDSVWEILSHAGPKALEAANRRWREILAYTRGERT